LAIMNLRRKCAGLIVTVLVLVALDLGWTRGWTTLTDISDALTFTLVGAIGATLYWTWKPEINRWVSDRNQPKLKIALNELRPEEEVKRVEVWLPNGEKRSHEARFCFITITNSGKRIAKNVRLYCGFDQMLLMPFKRKADYKVDGEWNRPEEFDEAVKKRGIETFVLATLDGVRQADSTTIRPGQHGESFVLFFTMKDFSPLCVLGFTRIYEHPHGSPPIVKLYLEAHYEDGAGYYTAEFEIVMKSWERLKPKLVETAFKPYS